MLAVAQKIVEVFQKQGHQALFAGGCVRDMLLQKEPLDYDIATSARPDDIEKIIRQSHLLDEKILTIGKDFGIIMAVVEGHHFEIATFRQDSSSSDGRRPDQIHFANVQEDALRRDFTINGLFYDPLTQKIHDYVGGQDDLKQGTIRFIGQPTQRIKEDYLRLLRAIRFKITLGFDYDQSTQLAIEQMASGIEKTSWERISDEVHKMIKQRKTGANYTVDMIIQELNQRGLLSSILPEIVSLQDVPQSPDHHAEGNVYIHTLRCLRSLHKDVEPEVVWAVLLHDVGKKDTLEITPAGKTYFYGHEEKSAEIATTVLDRFRFPKGQRDFIVWLVRHHMMLMSFFKMKHAKQRRWLMDPRFPSLLEVFRADAIGTSPTDLTEINQLEALYEQEKNELLLEPPKKLLTGKEIMDIFSLLPGPTVGEFLEAVTDAQLENRIHTKQQAIEYLQQLLSNKK